jgi:type II secretory pathway component PulK
MKHTFLKCDRPPTDRGFALVVTLTLMILLTVVAVGLLSLSAVSLRTTGQSSALSEARANARMALLLALGELQKHAGPDQRITAPWRNPRRKRRSPALARDLGFMESRLGNQRRRRTKPTRDHR